MVEKLGIFPFGRPVRRVEQLDRSPKKVFVLGVYASAVHAQWVGPDGRVRVRALAVDSEPSIFWRGEGAEAIVKKIDIPAAVGRLLPASPTYNGPSGLALDAFFLEPLHLTRESSWLCDLLPQACMNPSQKKAIRRAYLPLVETHDLPLPTVPSVPSAFTDAARRQAIKEEVSESGAGVLMLLGDKPIQWFLRYYDGRWQRLSDFGTTPDSYGKLHTIILDEKSIRVLPLAHPRQVARLGRASARWFDLHQAWLRGRSAEISGAIQDRSA